MREYCKHRTNDSWCVDCAQPLRDDLAKLRLQLSIATKALERINDRAPYSSVEADYSIEKLVKEALDEMEKV